MARKKKESGGGGNWMDTYGDMVTLLLTFFVMLYASSSVDESKWQYILEAFESRGEYLNSIIGKKPPVDDSSMQGQLDDSKPENTGEYPQNFDQLYHYLLNYVQENNLSDSVEVEKGASNVYIKFRDNIFFAGDSDVLLNDGKKILNELTVGISHVYDDILSIRVCGHTADFKSEVKETNLSAGRAVNVVNYMTENKKIGKSKFVSVGYGHTRPIATNDTEAGRRKNRRVEIILVRKDADFSDPAVLDEYLRMEFGIDYIGSPDLTSAGDD